MPIENREWDSRFFGYPVASASFGPALPRLPDILAARDEARQAAVRLLYLFLPPVDAALRSSIEQAGFLPVGQKVEYARKVGMPPPMEPGPDIALCRESSAPLEQLALESGSHSRFRLDPGFRNREFERLYGEWLASSLRGDQGKQVFVAGSAARPLGLVTLEPGPSAARIGLLAVDASQRGRGLGRRLVAEAERFCVRNRIAELQVATQSANRGACRFYETCGFGKSSETDVFHAWLMPSQAGP